MDVAGLKDWLVQSKLEINNYFLIQTSFTFNHFQKLWREEFKATNDYQFSAHKRNNILIFIW
jgi:hypothetical protein